MGSWGELLRNAAVAQVALLAIAAAGLRDLEAAALTVAGLVALALLRFRSGILGRLGLALLSADVAAWMATGAVSNLTHAEGFWETALPVALTVTAITTLVAAIAALLRRTDTAGPRSVTAVAVLVLIAGLVGSAVGVGSATEVSAGDLLIETKNVKFIPDEPRAVGAGRVGVVVKNHDLFWHTFTISELDINVNVPVGAERRGEFEAAPGTYEFVCAIPGHTQAGMKGTLVVR